MIEKQVKTFKDYYLEEKKKYFKEREEVHSKKKYRFTNIASILFRVNQK
ncbi:MAG: hypothetical protein ACOCRX_00710 [Candidatus Woesearchaeota archaeon]